MAALVFFISSGLVLVTVTIHLFVLRGLSHLARRMRSVPVLGMGVTIVTAILGHLFEIWIFALAVMAMCADGRFGELAGGMEHNLRDYFYYSALAYTSLGFGDVAPQGSLRTLAAVEAITGLVLIAWTASFAFLAMQELWGAKRLQG